MCLGLPGRVIEVEGFLATVDFFGVRRPVGLQAMDEPLAPGDYVLSHAGLAVRRIPKEEVGETLALYERLMQLAEQDEDVPGERARSG